MASEATRGPEDVRRQIAQERDELARAVDSLRDGMTLGPKLPVVAGGALAAGFVLAGGIGATVRLVFRRGREGKKTATVGRYAVVDRR
jgi:hypothetical protein